MPAIEEFVEELRDLLVDEPVQASQRLQALADAELPEVLNRLTLIEAATIIKHVPMPRVAELFNHPELRRRALMMEELEPAIAAKILEDMAADERTQVLRGMSPFERRRLLPLLSAKIRAEAEQLLLYSPDTAGGIMTTEFVQLDAQMSVEAALARIRSEAEDRESIYACYVLEPATGRLQGAVSLRDLVIAKPSALVSEVMRRKPVCVSIQEPRTQVADKISKYNLLAVPVLEDDGRVVGFVTVDDVIDVMVEDQTNSILRMGGIEAGALDEPYMSTPFLALVKKRATWLVLLFLGEMLTATAMGYFEDEISKAVVLALFLPLIISSGGNSGSQASTLVIRAMAIGELRLADWWKVAKRELGSGLLLGVILGIIGFMRIAIWAGFTNLYGPHWFLIGLAVSLSLIGVVLWGTISGSMLPLILRRVGIDPATSSAPLVATLVDVTGLVIYFTVALFILRGTIL